MQCHRSFTFLGTGTSTGIPEIGCPCPTCISTDSRDKRLRTSALICIDGARILIDAGPDFREQMLTHQVHSLDAILITHEHYDHVGGLDDIRPLYRGPKGCPVYAEPNVIEALRTRMPYAFSENRYPGVPSIDLCPIYPAVPFSPCLNVEVIPIRVNHGRLPIVGFRIGDLTYITDCKTLPDSSIDIIKGTKVLVLNTLRKYEHPSHLCLSEALDLITLLDPDRTFLIHFAHTFGPHREVRHLLPPKVFAAYDGLTISF